MLNADAHSVREALLYRAAFAALGVLGVVIVLVAGLDWLLRPDNFPVRNVRFEGEFQRVSHSELAVAVRDVVRGNFLLVDLDAVRRRVEALPWVHRVEVRRWWPRDVYVQFEEQRIVARWTEVAGGSRTRVSDVSPRAAPIGDSTWVNHVGEAVRLPDAEFPPDMPLLAGPAGTSVQVLEEYQRLAAALAAQGLMLKELTLTPRRTWELELTNGIRLVLDRQQPERKVERFARVYARALAAQAERIRRVDLRYENGFAVEWKAGMPARYEG
jgi:cell division protein FtsQ